LRQALRRILRVSKDDLPLDGSEPGTRAT
jgi:hypothetical protein